ncbi:MAG: OmpW/AlkL family protein [Pseudomonadota bacterium]
MRPALTLAILAASAAFALPAQAQTADTSREAGDWLVRLRAIMVAPTEDSGAVTPAFPGSEVGVDNAVMPEIDFTYMVTKHVGAELILATTKHDITGRGTLGGVGKLADTWVLPPTLTLQYHFMPEGKIHPYVGAGVNYTIFYSSKASGALEDAIGNTSVKLDDSFGYALQAGIDVDVTPNIFLNADIKYIDMSTTARLNTGGVKNTVDVDLNPIVAGVGIGFRF